MFDYISYFYITVGVNGFVIYTNASNQGYGVVLMQQGKELPNPWPRIKGGGICLESVEVLSI